LSFPLPSSVRTRAFTTFWTQCGPALSTDPPAPLCPLLSSMSGTVLDLGPGSGEQLHLYPSSQITKAYGIEPAVGLHLQLKGKAQAAGFTEQSYVVLDAGAQPESLVPALAKVGLLNTASGDAENGCFDYIVAIRVLCGVPQPQETLNGLYSLLKPGGSLIVSEHVVNETGRLEAWLQVFYEWIAGWRFWMAGCRLRQNTKEMIRQSAGVEGWAEERWWVVDGWSTIPKVVGVLVKKK
jgi:SAM-dependent methyltransferase